jgi:tetratricopeptide (TPR) repeat protein
MKARFGLAPAGAVALSLAMLFSIGCKTDVATQHREKAAEFANQSQWREAAQEYGLAIQADPSLGELWEQKAYAHLQLKEYEQVEAAMLKLADVRTDPPKKAAVYRNIGGMWVQQGLNDKAEPFFLKAAQVDPKDDQTLNWLAEIYAQRGGARANNAPAKPEALDKALEYLDKVTALKPGESAGYVNKRIAMMKYMEYDQKQKDEALKEAVTEKDAAKVKELQTKGDQAQAHFDKIKKQFDEVNQKLGELAKTAQGK